MVRCGGEDDKRDSPEGVRRSSAMLVEGRRIEKCICLGGYDHGCNGFEKVGVLSCSESAKEFFSGFYEKERQFV